MGLMSRALKSIWRRKWRTTVAVIAIAIAMAIMISIPTGLNSNQAAAELAQSSIESSVSSLNNEINNMSLVIEVSSSSFGRMSQGGGSNPGNMTIPSGTTSTTASATSATYITAEDISNITSMDGVVEVVAFYETMEGMPSMSSSGGFDRSSYNFDSTYTVYGIPTNETISGLTPTITSGRALYSNETGSIVISETLAETWNVTVGDTYTLNGTTVTIVGICSTSSSTSTSTSSTMSNRCVYMDVNEYQTIYGLDDNSYTNLYVYANSTDYVDEIATIISSELTSETVTTSSERISQLESSQSSLESSLESQNETLAQTEATANQEIVLTLGASSAIILLIMFFSVRERTREIGVMKTLGFSNKQVVKQFLLEGTSIALIGCAIGAVVGIIAYPTLSDMLMPSSSSGSGTGSMGGSFTQALSAATSSTPDLSTVMLAFVAVLAMGIIGSIYPAWRAAKIKPVEALRNE